jgi:hypothetical protein
MPGLDMGSFLTSDKSQAIAEGYPFPEVNLRTTSRNSNSIFWQSKIKGSAVVELPLGPDPAAMPLDNPLHDGQADAGAFEFLLTMQTLEGAEQVAGITLIKPGAVVLDVVNIFLALGPPTHLDDRRLPGMKLKDSKELNANLFG